jgi:hypothetical protein
MRVEAEVLALRVAQKRSSFSMAQIAIVLRDELSQRGTLGSSVLAEPHKCQGCRQARGQEHQNDEAPAKARCLPLTSFLRTFF